MRFDKPMGFVLLWAPTAWALWLANHGMPSIKLLGLFILGTVIMRAAGCVINDIADRKFDGFVSRTKNRPLITQEINLSQALFLFVILLVMALIIVVQLPTLCLYQAVIALLITIAYPFVKRFFYAPQLFLGLAFSMGIPMAFAASKQSFDSEAWLLFILNFLWILAYDTIYAMADKKDDLVIGVKSTAILFAEHDKLVVLMLQCMVHFFWLFIADIMHFKLQFYVFWLFGAYLFFQQQKLLKLNNEHAYFKGFLSNGWYGILMWFAMIISMSSS